MEKNWDILANELSAYGISLNATGDCRCEYKGRKLSNVPLKAKIKDINRDIAFYLDVFDEVWQNLLSMLSNPKHDSIKDACVEPLLIQSLKGLLDFVYFLFNDFEGVSKLKKSKLEAELHAALGRDIASYACEIAIGIIDCKVAIDWLYREICRLFYVRKLLKALLLKPRLSTKTAAGVQGPWSNLDLPMQERVFEWDEIEEDMHSRSKDIRKQYRYRKGLENYNNDGRVGEGHYWRELRNEPFLWENRATESPYPGRQILMR